MNTKKYLMIWISTLLYTAFVPGNALGADSGFAGIDLTSADLNDYVKNFKIEVQDGTTKATVEGWTTEACSKVLEFKAISDPSKLSSASCKKGSLPTVGFQITRKTDLTEELDKACKESLGKPVALAKRRYLNENPGFELDLSAFSNSVNISLVAADVDRSKSALQCPSSDTTSDTFKKYYGPADLANKEADRLAAEQRDAQEREKASREKQVKDFGESCQKATSRSEIEKLSGELEKIKHLYDKEDFEQKKRDLDERAFSILLSQLENLSGDSLEDENKTDASTVLEELKVHADKHPADSAKIITATLKKLEEMTHPEKSTVQEAKLAREVFKALSSINSTQKAKGGSTPTLISSTKLEKLDLKIQLLSLLAAATEHGLSPTLETDLSKLRKRLSSLSRKVCGKSGNETYCADLRIAEMSIPIIYQHAMATSQNKKLEDMYQYQRVMQAQQGMYGQPGAQIQELMGPHGSHGFGMAHPAISGGMYGQPSFNNPYGPQFGQGVIPGMPGFNGGIYEPYGGQYGQGGFPGMPGSLPGFNGQYSQYGQGIIPPMPGSSPGAMPFNYGNVPPMMGGSFNAGFNFGTNSQPGMPVTTGGYANPYMRF